MAEANSDGVVQAHYSGSAGALLLAQGKHEEAVSRLEEDEDNPFSMQRLIQAYQKTGDKHAAERVTQKLVRYNEPLIEQAMVVIPFRKSRAASFEPRPERTQLAMEW